MYRCIFNFNGTALNSAHIQHIIDQTEQMLAGCTDFFQIIQNKLCIINMCCRKYCESDDRIHGCTDIMGHITQKRCFRPVRMLRSCKCISQILILRYLTFFFLCGITVCNQNGTKFPVFIISLRHNDHCQPSFIRCLSCKAQHLTFLQTL